MPRVMHIAEVGLRVKDLARRVAFYQDVLGFDDPEGNTIELIAHDPAADSMRPS